MNIIETDRFIIRNWTNEDAIGLINAKNNPSIAKGLSEMNLYPYSLEYAIEHIKLCQKENNSNFTITINNKIAGEIGSVFYYKPLIASINCWLSVIYQGKGIATDAVNIFTEYIFKKYPVYVMGAQVLEWNKKSAEVLERAGYKLEFTRPARNPDTDEIARVMQYSKTNFGYIFGKRVSGNQRKS